MKLLKISSLSFFVLASLFVSSPAFAVDAPVVAPAPQPKMITLANANIQGAKIISQDKNNIKISFDIKNGSIPQTGIKYSVSLVKDISNIENTIDQYVYPETLDLVENSLIKKDITYTAPASIGGEFYLVLKLKTSSNIILGVSNLGNVKLASTLNTVEILPTSCYLSVTGEKSAPKYTLTKNVDISATEKLNINCSVSNPLKKDIIVTPSYETHLQTLYGDTIATTGGDTSPIVFKAGEKKTVSLALPKTDIPNDYAVKVSFKSDSIDSNSVVAYYKIGGTSASIQSLLIDKDFYKSGDTAKVSILWSHSFSQANARIKTPEDESISLSASIVNSDQKACATPIEKTLKSDSSFGPLEIPFKITRLCNNPEVSIQMKSSNGEVLVDRHFAFKTNTESKDFTKANSFFAKYGLIIFIILGILVVAGISIYFKNLKRKDDVNHDLSKSNETTL